jgi:pimeloyl-ACP methyl ester carboxylesterase
MTEPVRKSMPMEDGALSYLEWESGGPTLHFSHANGFNARTYRTLLEPLAERFHIYAGDLRGHGLSTLATPPGFTRGWTVLRDDMIRFLDGLGGGPVLLAGHSIGGVVSLMTAVTRPDLVRALVLVEPVFVPAIAPWLYRLSKILGRKRHVSPDLAARAARRRDIFESVEAMEDSYRGRGAFKGWSDAMLHDYVVGGTVPTEDGKVRLSCAPRVESETFMNTPIAMYRLARKVACPVTLIHGGQSGSTCHAREAAIFAAKKPDTRVVTVPDSGHFLPMEHPEVVRDEIVRMGERVGAGVSFAGEAVRGGHDGRGAIHGQKDSRPRSH